MYPNPQQVCPHPLFQVAGYCVQLPPGFCDGFGTKLVPICRSSIFMKEIEIPFNKLTYPYISHLGERKIIFKHTLEWGYVSSQEVICQTLGCPSEMHEVIRSGMFQRLARGLGDFCWTSSYMEYILTCKLRGDVLGPLSENSSFIFTWLRSKTGNQWKHPNLAVLFLAPVTTSCRTTMGVSSFRKGTQH